MKRDWFYYAACLIVPHIMLIVGLIFLSRPDPRRKLLGKKVCILSTLILVVGSFIYYLFFIPVFGLD